MLLWRNVINVITNIQHPKHCIGTREKSILVWSNIAQIVNTRTITQIEWKCITIEFTGDLRDWEWALITQWNVEWNHVNLLEQKNAWNYRATNCFTVNSVHLLLKDLITWNFTMKESTRDWFTVVSIVTREQQRKVIWRGTFFPTIPMGSKIKSKTEMPHFAKKRVAHSKLWMGS